MGGWRTLTELIASLADMPEHDRYAPSPTIYARRPWNPDTEATVLHGETITAPGFTYVLEVDLAKEAIEVWSERRDGRTPTLAEAVDAVIWYADHDAYQPTADRDH